MADTLDKLSREEFEKAYAARSGVTVEFLHSSGEKAYPCDCGDAMCQGWQMIRNKDTV